jgi:hypothetical protein
MNKPTQTPRRNYLADRHTHERHDGSHVRHGEATSSFKLDAPTPNRTHAAGATAQLKPQAAAPFMNAFARGAGTPAGAIQANIVGGTRSLHARLIALHAAEHRVAASRGAVQGFGRVGANMNAQSVQCKSSFGVDAFKVSLQPKTGGQPLPSEVRAKMEAAFGADFSDVRVHVGHEASRIGAIAYTWGTNIHFAPGHYNPHTLQGQKVLGHELWHVVQQKSGRVKNPFGGGVAVVQDHALEAEADRMGIKAAMTSVPRSACCD